MRKNWSPLVALFLVSAGMSTSQTGKSPNKGAVTFDISPDGKFLAMGNSKGEFWTADSVTLQTLHRYPPASGRIVSVKYSGDGTRLLTLLGNPRDLTGTWHVWDASTQKLMTTRKIDAWAPLHAISHNGATTTYSSTVLGSVSNPTEVIAWDTATGKTLRTLTLGHEDASSIALSPDGKRLAVGGTIGGTGLLKGRNACVRVWKLDDGKLQFVLRGMKTPPNALDWSANGTYLVSVGDNQLSYIWRMDTGEVHASRQTPHSLTTTSVSLSSDGSMMVTGGIDKADNEASTFDNPRAAFRAKAWKVGITKPLFVLKQAAGTDIHRFVQGDQLLVAGYSSSSDIDTIDPLKWWSLMNGKLLRTVYPQGTPK